MISNCDYATGGKFTINSHAQFNIIKENSMQKEKCALKTLSMLRTKRVYGQKKNTGERTEVTGESSKPLYFVGGNDNLMII